MSISYINLVGVQHIIVLFQMMVEKKVKICY